MVSPLAVMLLSITLATCHIAHATWSARYVDAGAGVSVGETAVLLDAQLGERSVGMSPTAPQRVDRVSLPVVLLVPAMLLLFCVFALPVCRARRVHIIHRCWVVYSIIFPLLFVADDCTRTTSQIEGRMAAWGASYAPLETAFIYSLAGGIGAHAHVQTPAVLVLTSLLALRILHIARILGAWRLPLLSIVCSCVPLCVSYSLMAGIMAGVCRRSAQTNEVRRA